MSVVSAIRQSVTVQPGGVVEVRSAELPAGATAEVIVLVDAPPSAAVPARPAGRTWGDFIGSARGSFKSVAEVDAYIRELRDEWDR